MNSEGDKHNASEGLLLLSPDSTQQGETRTG